MVLFQSSLRVPLSSYNFMEHCSYKMGEFGEDEFNRVTFHSCTTYLMDLDSHRLNISEEEFRRRVDEQNDLAVFDRLAS